MQGLSVALVALVLCCQPTTTAGCAVADDCSLGGECINGQCKCWPIWKGENCSLLNLLPATPTTTDGTSYPAAWARPGNQSSWGGRPIYDEEAGAWRLYAADMSMNCGLNSWQRNSVISTASAPAVDGPYTFEKQIEPAFAHNPTVHKHPDGTYVIYHIGNGVPSSHGKPINNCINGTTPPSATVRTGASQSSAGAVAANVPGDSDGGGTSIGQDADTVLGPSPPEIGSIVAPTMLISRSPTGPWSRAPTTRAPPRTGEGGRESPGASSCNNPAAYFFPNGTVVLICKVMSAPSNGIRQMQVSTAPSWRGPYTVRSTPAVFGEDAFIWRANEDGNFHMLLHSMHPSKICTTAWSSDAIHWTPAFKADLNTTLGETYPSYSHTFELTNGKTFQAGRRERHQLAFDASGNPTHLLNGVGDIEGKADFTFTSLQPLNQK